MSFTDLKIAELKKVAESFGVDVTSVKSKNEIAALLEEEGITYQMYNKFVGAEKEEIEICEVDIATLYGTLPTLEAVENLAKKYLKDTYRHCLDVATVMKHFAKKLHQNEELWYIA